MNKAAFNHYYNLDRLDKLRIQTNLPPFGAGHPPAPPRGPLHTTLTPRLDGSGIHKLNITEDTIRLAKPPTANTKPHPYLPQLGVSRTLVHAACC
ncbi:hypothetical protein BLNAU_16782 [Blattamonas nauphoetae]|uniref:Uncharacterized protein n=1 Tax=Blattamonas nauphoetae TaxID=2049346 RepID=A0ABQ9XAN6_9EUKA|nr:hypothetical protein BLNAU_16782 [Blattamonas nauphoetae]